MLNFDEGHIAGTMGLPRVMEWLRVLKKDDKGSVKLGHGKQFLKYKLIKSPRRLRNMMQMFKNVSVNTIQVLTSDLLRKAVAQLRSRLHKATSRKRQALVAAPSVSGVPSSVSGGRRCRITRKMHVKTPPKISAATRAAIELLYCQKDFLRKEITLWLADHTDAGTNKVDWNCITIKDVVEWSPEQCTELEPLHSRTVQDRRGRACFWFGTAQPVHIIRSGHGCVLHQVVFRPSGTPESEIACES